VTAEQKLLKIQAMCGHPSYLGGTGHKLAQAIKNVIDDDAPILYSLSDIDEPVHYELVHDAVFEYEAD
jgi:hypothetical protein